MEIKTFYCNPLRECSYVAWDETGECVIIDPGFYGERELQRLRDFVKEKELKPVKILLTHGHFDHVLGLEDVAREWHLDAWLHPADREQIVRSGEWCAQLGLAYHPFTGTWHDLADGDTVSFGHSQLKVLATPGHTEGGVCFLCGKEGVVFTGDTLFCGTYGRTDFPGGSQKAIFSSIRDVLFKLPAETRVFPGHEQSTTIGKEQVNPVFVD